MIVYFHRHPQTNEIFYVGIGAKKDRAYCRSKKSRNRYWHRYVAKHGEPIVEIVHTVETRKEAIELELKYISEFGRKCDGSGCLVNITLGGDGGALGVKRTKEQIERQAAAMRGKKRSPRSIANYKAAQNRPEVKEMHAKIKTPGSPWSQKQSAAKMGKKQSTEMIQKRSNSLKGHAVSEETKRKISATNTGKIRTAEMRANYSAAALGRGLSQETINKIVEKTKKLVLNTQTGIYYHGLQEAADSVSMKLGTLRPKMSGHSKNTTPFIYA